MPYCPMPLSAYIWLTCFLPAVATSFFWARAVSGKLCSHEGLSTHDICLCVYIYIHMYICIHVCVYIYIYINIYIYIYIYMYTHIHTHTYAHIRCRHVSAEPSSHPKLSYLDLSTPDDLSQRYMKCCQQTYGVRVFLCIPDVSESSWKTPGNEAASNDIYNANHNQYAPLI